MAIKTYGFLVGVEANEILGDDLVYMVKRRIEGLYQYSLIKNVDVEALGEIDCYEEPKKFSELRDQPTFMVTEDNN